MKIKIISHRNEDKERIEYLLANFDYFDGNELIAKELCEKFGMKLVDKKDGVFYNVINLKKNEDEYFLMWHEDAGNFAYSASQRKETNLELKKMLESIVGDINEKMNK